MGTGLWVSGCLGIWVSGFLGVWVSGCWVLGVGCLDIGCRSIGCLGIGCLGGRSGCEVWVLGLVIGSGSVLFHWLWLSELPRYLFHPFCMYSFCPHDELPQDYYHDPVSLALTRKSLTSRPRCPRSSIWSTS